MKDRDGDSRATASWPDDVIARCEESLSAQKRQALSFLLLHYSIITACGAWEEVHGTRLDVVLCDLVQVTAPLWASL